MAGFQTLAEGMVKAEAVGEVYLARNLAMRSLRLQGLSTAAGLSTGGHVCSVIRSEFIVGMMRSMPHMTAKWHLHQKKLQKR